MLRICCKPLGNSSGSSVVYSLLEQIFIETIGGYMPMIEKTPIGKPYFPDKPDIHFSLSHSRTHAMCAISDSPVGVDIETPRAISGRALSFFATKEELSIFDPLDLWVLKESYIKLFGLSLIAARNLRFIRRFNLIFAPNPTVKSGLYLVDGCPAAVSSLGDSIASYIELITGSSNPVFWSAVGGLPSAPTMD